MAEHYCVNRIVFLIGGGLAIFGSYLAVILGLTPYPGLGPSTFAGIALPALVSGLVMAAFIAIEAKETKHQTGMVGDLHAQLARKEIEISRLSALDELTGLATRLHFDETVQLEFKRSERHGRPLALMLIEIDDLQDVGDRVGALSKGYLLSEVGAMLRTQLRLNDIGCRYTIEQLAVLMPETDAIGAHQAAEKIRTLAGEREFLSTRPGEGFHLTVSQGIASMPSSTFTSHLDFLKAAESALAQARVAGRDQVFVIAADLPVADASADVAEGEAEQLAS